MTHRETRVFDTPQALSHAACDAFCDLARQTLDEQAVFRVALAGGSTPKKLYQLLADREVDWGRVRLFWGDERNVPLDDAESNYRMVREALLDPAQVPAESCFPVPIDPANPAGAAAAYEQTLRQQFTLDSGVPRFDLILLGIGEDAHTASLFPETGALEVRDSLYVANWVPKLDAYRLTVTVPVINAGRNVWLLASGAGKRAALDAVWNGLRDPGQYPSQLVAPAGRLVWWLDKDAAP